MDSIHKNEHTKKEKYMHTRNKIIEVTYYTSGTARDRLV